MRPRLLLADDQPLLLEGLQLMLEPEFEIVGSARDGRALLVSAIKLKPDAILMGISLPLLNGIDAAVQLRKVAPTARILFVTMHADPELMREAFQAGAFGYLLKSATSAELICAIRDVLKGRRYVSPLLEPEWPSARIKPQYLTPRQREVLQLVAEGHSNKQVGSVLHISVKTVEFHKAALMRTLNLWGTADLTRYSIEHGLVSAPRLPEALKTHAAGSAKN